ncbi:hypothetical protein K4K61_002833 [Colletotrichum sp. SAR11_59]|nr:hypothetical protein K4K61_002833 [Colletotrichum sp. SAR11_59]
MDVKFPEVVDWDTPEDVGEAMADEFQVDHGDSTGCVKVGPAGNDVLKSELGKIDVPGAVPVAVTDELDAVNGGTRVADFEPDTVEEAVALPFLLAEEPTDAADEIEELTAGDGARVVVFHVPLELELELVDVSETVARVPDSVSVVVGDEIAPDNLLDDEESPEEADVAEKIIRVLRVSSMVFQVVEDCGLDLVLLAMDLKRGSRGAAHQRREQRSNRRDAGGEIRNSHVDELTEG